MTPRRWQSEALARWTANGCRGVVGVVTGGGKTKFAMLCIEALRLKHASVRVVILVPTLALLDQWFISLLSELDVGPNDIACYSGEERAETPGPICLVVLNTARKMIAQITSGAATFLIVDECHRAGSPANAKSLGDQNLATLGLSATPVREYDDGFCRYIRPVLGEIIYEYGYAEALSDGVIAPFNLVNVEVALLDDERREYDRVSRRIVGAYRRIEEGGGNEEGLRRLLQHRAQISSRATMRIPVAAHIAESHRGTKTIVFHERIRSAQDLISILNARKQRPTSYHSRLSPATRRDNLRLFSRGAFDILVTCRALDEGLDLPEMSVAILASSTASTRQRIQRLGRVLRPGPEKGEATIYTLYATAPERDRLSGEAKRLEGIASVTWRRASFLHGTNSS